jgi:hypothetical protein
MKMGDSSIEASNFFQAIFHKKINSCAKNISKQEIYTFLSKCFGQNLSTCSTQLKHSCQQNIPK